MLNENEVACAEISQLLEGIALDYSGKPLSAAIIGFGKMGLLHSAILNLLGSEAVVKYIVDKDRIIRLGGKLLLRKKGVEFFDSVEKLLNIKDRVDLVYVTTSTQAHYPIACRLVEADMRNIFIEKPPTRDLDQFHDLLDRAKGCRVMVGFQKRFSLPFRHAKLLIRKGVVGELRSIRCHVKSGDVLEPTSRFKKLGRGVLLDLGIHALDLLCWIFNGKVDEVKVSSVELKSLYSGVDDHFKALLTLNGIAVEFETTWSDPAYRLPETYLEFEGCEGVIRATDDYVKISPLKPDREAGSAQLAWYKPNYYRGFPPVLVADPEYTIEDEHFLTIVEKDLEPYSNLKSCESTMALLEELYKAASRG